MSVDVTAEDVQSALKRGNPGKSPGPDGITLSILKAYHPRWWNISLTRFPFVFAKVSSRISGREPGLF